MNSCAGGPRPKIAQARWAPWPTAYASHRWPSSSSVNCSSEVRTKWCTSSRLVYGDTCVNSGLSTWPGQVEVAAQALGGQPHGGEDPARPPKAHLGAHACVLELSDHRQALAEEMEEGDHPLRAPLHMLLDRPGPAHVPLVASGEDPTALGAGPPAAFDSVSSLMPSMVSVLSHEPRADTRVIRLDPFGSLTRSPGLSHDESIGRDHH